MSLTEMIHRLDQLPANVLTANGREYSREEAGKMAQLAVDAEIALTTALGGLQGIGALLAISSDHEALSGRAVAQVGNLVAELSEMASTAYEYTSAGDLPARSKLSAVNQA